MKLLAIETSCDETAIAIVQAQEPKDSRLEILANIVSSQVKIHQKYGGVYPFLAKREHQKNLVPILKTALSKARLLKAKSKSALLLDENQKSGFQSKIQGLRKILGRDPTFLENLKRFLVHYQKPDLNILAVTIGPGLEPCLWTGINLAKTLAFWWNLSIIPVNHIEAHVLINLLGKANESKDIWPAVCLVVSGGHTQLVLMKKIGRYQVIGETRDDAAGECFDKTARILGLPYPGGPAIASEAEKSRKRMSAKSGIISQSLTDLKLPRPMIHSKNYDFSFSGLKTAVLYDSKKRGQKTRKSKDYVQKMAHEIQEAIVEVLVKKTIKAAKNFQAKSVILGGGVAANTRLRTRLEKNLKKELPDIFYFQPNPSFCTDNAVMVAIAGLYHLGQKKEWRKIKAQANLRIG